MKFIPLIFLLTISLFSLAQNDIRPVNRESVENEVSEEESENYYPKLMERYSDFDPSLSVEDYRLLYYGFVFQPKYTGYPALMQKEIRAAMAARDYEEAIKICDKVLESYPVCLSANFFKSMALYQSGETDSTLSKYKDRNTKLTDAILSSGNGLTCATAFKTIFVDDQYQLIFQHFGVTEVVGQHLEYPCDRIAIKPSQYFIEKSIYFDTSETLGYLQKIMDPGKRKKKKRKS